ncbi:MAG: ABC transporter permease [Acidimicrobiales bacterium]
MDVSGLVARVAWYRFCTTWHRRWAGYLTIAALVGLLGGLAMGAIAGARRTQSSFPSFLANSNPSDLTTIYNGADTGYDPTLVNTLAHLPHVTHLESVATLNTFEIGSNGAPVESVVANTVGSVDGLLLDQDRAFVSEGRLPDPLRRDEAVTTVAAARALGLHLGSVIRLGFYTQEQTLDPGYGTASVAPYLRADVTLVGVGVTNDSVVQDEFERSAGGLLLTPALTRELLECCANGTFSGLQLEHRSRDVAAVETEIENALPPDTGFYIRDSSVAEAKAERAIRPESIAFGVFGGIAALAALLIAAQVIGRQLRLGMDELETLRALGAGPSMTTSDGLLGIGAAVVAGTLLAGAVSIGLSPFAPIGPVRPVDPSAGIAFDWTVLGLGCLVLTVTLGAVALVLSYRRAPHRLALRSRRPGERDSTLARAAAASRLPVTAVAGIRFALSPGPRGNTVPVRSAILGATLAMVVVSATLTFGSSLHTLVTRPTLYGWNWDYALEPPGGGVTIDGSRARELLDHDPYVGAWTGVSFDNLRIDGLTIPVLGGEPNATISPPILSGHGLDAPDEIVLGATTLTQLHKHVGDTVDAGYGTLNTVTRLRIVGTATLPAVGAPQNQHVSMGTGALVSHLLIPGTGSSAGNAGPNAIFVRLPLGADPAASLASLQAVADALYSPTGGPVSVLSVQRPAEIANYRSMGTTPIVLGATLAAGALSALALTLMASVRRRRRELALLKVLGFTRRQVAVVVAWQSSVAVVIGIVIGVPLGVALGRFLWRLFANNIHVVPAPSVPTLSVALVAVGGLVLANLMAAIPGRIAGNTPTALLLRTE